MRDGIAIVFVLIAAICGFCQSTPAEHIIDREVRSGMFEGFDQRIVGTMGDSAAVQVTKIIGGGPISPTTVDNSLVVLTNAFADPSIIENIADREPRTTLFVLQYFDSLTTEQALKTRIAETRRAIKDRYEKYLKATTPK